MEELLVTCIIVVSQTKVIPGVDCYKTCIKVGPIRSFISIEYKSEMFFD